MRRVNIYIATESPKLQEMTRWTGYVMECEVHGEAKTKETFKQRTGSYHMVCLQMIAESLGRMKEKCEICINCPDVYVANLMGNIDGMAATGFRTKNGNPVKNELEWKTVYERMRGHLVTVESGVNKYSEWLRFQMEAMRESDNKIRANNNK